MVDQDDQVPGMLFGGVYVVYVCTWEKHHHHYGGVCEYGTSMTHITISLPPSLSLSSPTHPHPQHTDVSAGSHHGDPQHAAG